MLNQKLRLLDAVVDGDSRLDVQSQHHPNELAERVREGAAVVRVVLREADVRVQNRQLHDALHRTLERARAERHRVQRAAQRPNVHAAVDYASHSPHTFTVHARTRVVQLGRAVGGTAVLLRVLL